MDGGFWVWDDHKAGAICKREHKGRDHDGRHLKSSNDVFNFVKNNIGEGVNKAKKLNSKLKEFLPGPTKDVENKIGEVLDDQKWLDPVKKIIKLPTAKQSENVEVPIEKD
jgi:hypothetical protein